MDFKDYYKILGLEPDADGPTIKKVYRKLARKYHPDVSKQDDAEDRFKEIAEAYAVLKDAEKRAEYDKLRAYGAAGQEFKPPPEWSGRWSAGTGEAKYDGDFSDFFSTMFGENRGRGREASGARASYAFDQKGQDVETDLLHPCRRYAGR